MKEILKRVAMKLTSAKLLITIWAMVIVSHMVFTNTAKDNTALVMMLASAPLVYCGLNVVQKNIQKGDKNDETGNM
jgi:hypothetical protein